MELVTVFGPGYGKKLSVELGHLIYALHEAVKSVDIRDITDFQMALLQSTIETIEKRKGLRG